MTRHDIDLTDAVSAAGAESLTPCSLCERPGVTLCQPCRDETEGMLLAALPHIEKQIRAQVARELLLERDHARHAHRSAAANVDHFAHDYCRWVGHAEALTQAARTIARTPKETDHA